MEVIKARVFLNETFVLKLMYLLIIACFLFIIFAAADILCIIYYHECIVLGIQLTQLMKKITIIGLLLCTLVTCRLWYSLLAAKAKPQFIDHAKGGNNT